MPFLTTDFRPAVAAGGAPGYYKWVDALRGVAALAIIISHYHHFYLTDYLARDRIPDVSQFPYGSVLGVLFEYGPFAVQLFWVISGFVFAHVYLNRPTTLHEFTVARFARLYPLHLAMLLTVAALQALNWQISGSYQIYGNNDLRHFALQLVMASNWSTLSRGLSFNGPIWSVSFELVAYAGFFVSLGLLRRFGLVVAIPLCASMAWLSRADWFEPPLLQPAALSCEAYFAFGTKPF